MGWSGLRPGGGESGDDAPARASSLLVGRLAPAGDSENSVGAGQAEAARRQRKPSAIWAATCSTGSGRPRSRAGQRGHGGEADQLGPADQVGGGQHGLQPGIILLPAARGNCAGRLPCLRGCGPHLACWRCRSSRPATWPGITPRPVSVRNAVTQCPSMSVKVSCAPGWGIPWAGSAATLPATTTGRSCRWPRRPRRRRAAPRLRSPGASTGRDQIHDGLGALIDRGPKENSTLPCGRPRRTGAWPRRSRSGPAPAASRGPPAAAGRALAAVPAQPRHQQVEQPRIGLADAAHGSAVESRDHVPHAWAAWPPASLDRLRGSWPACSTKTCRFTAAAHPQVG